MKPRVLLIRRIGEQCNPDLVEGDEGSHCWRPQTSKQKDAPRGCNQALCQGDGLRRFPGEAGGTEIDQRDTETQPQQQQANTGPAVRKS